MSRVKGRRTMGTCSGLRGLALHLLALLRLRVYRGACERLAFSTQGLIGQHVPEDTGKRLSELDQETPASSDIDDRVDTAVDIGEGHAQGVQSLQPVEGS
jgi:hypothetical protein